MKKPTNPRSSSGGRGRKPRNARPLLGPQRVGAFRGKRAPSYRSPQAVAREMAMAGMRSQLKKAGIAVMQVKSLPRGATGRQESLKRFARLTIKDHAALIERIAADYAKMINAGLMPNSVGLETYFMDEEGAMHYCFANLDGIKPVVGPAAVRERLRAFYNSISMDDFNARTFFVQCLKEKLEPKNKDLFAHAIASRGRSDVL